jgi:exopolysaccharide biosynthesis WecB/TagA/CpsF family protein
MMNWSADPAHPVRVNVASRAGLLQDLAARMAARQGFTLATLNLDHVVKLRANAAFRAAYAAHSHITADGNPIVWLSGLAGQGMELVPGSELVGPVAALAAQAGVPLGLFGSSDAALAGAARVLEGLYPDLRIVAKISPPYGFDPAGPVADGAIDALAAAGARLVFVALGAPKQEIFAARAAGRMPEAGFLSIGAGLDFLSGHQRRASPLAQRLKAEWLVRLAQDPRRLGGRYAACVAILPRLTGEALQARRHPGEV